MRLLITLMLVMVVPAFVVAEERSESESFAAEMISCAYQNSTYSLGPGTASAARKAQLESVVYLAAAQKATSSEYVEAQTPALKKAAQDSVMKEITIAKKVDDIILKWNAVKTRCDASLNSRSSAQ